MGWRLSAPANIPAGDAASLTLPKTETLTDETPDTDADAALLAATWRYVERHTGTLWLPAAGGRRCVSELHPVWALLPYPSFRAMRELEVRCN